MFEKLKISDEVDYIPFEVDGVELKKTEILFTNEELRNGVETLSEDWELEESQVIENKYLSIDMIGKNGIEAVYEDLDAEFPIALKKKLRDGRQKFAPIKVKAGTDKILPIHAGCVPVEQVVAVGRMSSGKTCLRLQMTDLPYFDLIASGTDTAIYDDFPAIDLLKREQDEERRAFIYEQVLPEGTKVNSIYPANYYMISAPKRNILLKYDDISGEECINMDWNSSILNASYIIFMIDSNELLGKEVAKYHEILDQLLPKVKIKKAGQDYKIFVAITRADLLLEQNEKLAGICQKTLSWDGKRYTKLVHKNGFNLKEFNKKQMAIKEYLSQDCPDFYNTIRRYIGEDKLVYGLLASIGSEPVRISESDGVEWKYEYNPQFIEEPIMYLLNDSGLYPTATEKKEESKKETKKETKSDYEEDEESDETDVEGLFDFDNLKEILKKKFKKTVR